MGRYLINSILPPLEQSITRHPSDQEYDGNELHDRSEGDESAY